MHSIYCARAVAKTHFKLRLIVELFLFFIRYVVVTTGAKQI